VRLEQVQDTALRPTPTSLSLVAWHGEEVCENGRKSEGSLFWLESGKLVNSEVEFCGLGARKPNRVVGKLVATHTSILTSKCEPADK
jgi:hypothetical protein